MVSLSTNLKNVLSAEHFEILNSATEIASLTDTDLYLVGGCVRDVILGCAEKDFDIDLTGTKVDRDFADRLAEKLGGVVQSSSAFGTHKLFVSSADDSHIEIDVALSRSETYKSPGRLPEVEPGDIFQDLARRDFSIGAMCIVLRPPDNSDWNWGQLIDPQFGNKDLINKELRILHPKSFQDDPTRMFRILRYAGRLGFKLEANTQKLFTSSLQWISNLSGERIRNELERIFEETHTAQIVINCVTSGLLSSFLNKIDLSHLSAFNKLQLNAMILSDRIEFWFGLILCKANSEEIDYLCDQLNLNSKQRKVLENVTSLKTYLDNEKHILFSDDVKSSEVYKLLVGYDPIAIHVCALISSNNAVKAKLDLYVNSLMGISTILDGGDLISLGVKEGPELGVILNNLLYAKLDGQLKSRADEEKFVKIFRT